MAKKIKKKRLTPLVGKMEVLILHNKDTYLTVGGVIIATIETIDTNKNYQISHAKKIARLWNDEYKSNQ